MLFVFELFVTGRDKGGFYHELFLRDKQFLAYRIPRMTIKGTPKGALSKRKQVLGEPPDFYRLPFLPNKEAEFKRSLRVLMQNNPLHDASPSPQVPSLGAQNGEEQFHAAAVSSMATASLQASSLPGMMNGPHAFTQIPAPPLPTAVRSAYSGATSGDVLSVYVTTSDSTTASVFLPQRRLSQPPGTNIRFNNNESQILLQQVPRLSLPVLTLPNTNQTRNDMYSAVLHENDVLRAVLLECICQSAKSSL